MERVNADVNRITAQPEVAAKIAELDAIPHDPRLFQIDPHYHPPEPLSTEAPGPRANLREARLTRASLQRADLQGADLRDADLSGCDLGGADLTGAWLSGARVDPMTHLNSGWTALEFQALRDRGVQVVAPGAFPSEIWHPPRPARRRWG